MFPPIAINPLDALRLVTGKTKHGPVIQLEVEAGGGHYLAEAVPGLPPASSFPFDPPGTLRAALDGYALPPGSGAGDELDTGADLASILEDGRDAPPEGSACRVEAGGLLPPKTWAILPVSNGTLLGTGKVRIDLLPQAAEGILGRHNGTPRDIEAGTLLSPRIQAHLLAAGISRARVYSPPRVGVLLLGEELMDLKAELAGDQVYDLNGYWLIGAIEALGLEVVPLGISEDGPEGVSRHLHRCRTRQIDVLILCGGTGSGLSDRSAEAIRELNGKVLLEKLALRGCDSLVFGKLAEMDVLGLSGGPLSCAAGFDLFCRPMLLARSGASAGYWNWTKHVYEAEMMSPPPPVENKEKTWSLQVGKISEKHPETLIPATVKSWNPETPFSPLAAGSEGWVLRPAPAGDTTVYYVGYL